MKYEELLKQLITNFEIEVEIKEFFRISSSVPNWPNLPEKKIRIEEVFEKNVEEARKKIVELFILTLKNKMGTEEINNDNEAN